jgi:hypothetical protein
MSNILAKVVNIFKLAERLLEQNLARAESLQVKGRKGG